MVTRRRFEVRDRVEALQIIEEIVRPNDRSRSRRRRIRHQMVNLAIESDQVAPGGIERVKCRAFVHHARTAQIVPEHFSCHRAFAAQGILLLHARFGDSCGRRRRGALDHDRHGQRSVGLQFSKI